MARIHYVIPDELHREAKAQAALRGETLRQFIVDALLAATNGASADGVGVKSEA